MLRKRRRARSASSVLDEILQALRREQRASSLESAVAAYYTGLSSEGHNEQVAWGNFALDQFPDEG